MSFASAQILWLLLVLPPALVAFFWWSWRTRQRLVTQFIQARLLPNLTVGISPQRQKVRLACIVLGVIFLLLALARPQWGFEWEETKQRGLDIVVAIDTSRSMLAEDIPPNRLARAKLAALDLMQQAHSDRLGLIAFAGSAFLQCPLTVDDAAFRQSVEALDVNIIPEGGTALSEAIETAQTAFDEGDNFKVLVLFTDGEDQEPGAIEAAKKAAGKALRIFTVGIGSTEGELLRIKDAKGRTDYIRDEQGNVVKSHLNENLLRDIATEAQGFYLPLRGAKTVETLYKEGLAPLPKSEAKEKLIKHYHERFQWPLSFAIILLLVEMFFPERKRELKTRPALTTAPALREMATVLLLLMLSAGAALCSSSSGALREYKAGKYDQALKDYEDLLKRNGDDPRLHFNAGTAAYQSHRFDEAEKQFNEALNSRDLKMQEQAYYNRGNTLFHLGDKLEDPKKKTESWERSVKDFESTLKLNPQDPDAKFNYEFVMRKLEELKQQQQKQQQQNSDDKDKQDKKDQQQQQQNQQDKDSKKDQQQQQQDQQSKDQQKQDQDQKKDSSQQNQQQANQKQQEEKDKQEQQANQSQQQKDKQQQEQQQQQAKKSGDKPQPDKSDDKNQGQQEPAYAAGQMTPQQAQQLLDSQKNDEMMIPIKPTNKVAERNRPVRDW
jgi:Ca-activated chloride channel family protein